MRTNELKTTALTRRERLKAATDADHKTLDALVSGRQFFASVGRYGTWLQHSFEFHKHMELALERAGAARLLTGWCAHTNSTLIGRDLSDLGITLPPSDQSAAIKLTGQAECLGALYVIEGASMGARVLLIAAHRLGLNAERGARQLTAAASNIDRWRKFVAMLEAAALSREDEDQMISAARRTFGFAERCFGMAYAEQP